jgi:2-oxoisovalerate dehydrogenase E1 component
MNTTVFTSWDQLAELDVANDLNGRVLHVSAEGVSWIPRVSPDLSPSRLLELYYYMALTRAVDREIVKLLRKGLAFGKHLMCTGNEATAVGATSALRESDWAALGIRDLGVYMVRGVATSRVLAQACGRATGLTEGWDGSLHMGSRPHRIVGLVSHLGTLVAIGAGCAFGERYQDTDNAVLAFVGEGATSTGDFHEALNIASVLRLPLVVVIENNQWAFGTPARLQFAVPTLALRALGYGMKVDGYCIDGTDVLTVYETVRQAADRARSEQRISIIEAVSMRFEGHSLADPFNRYVPSGQLELWKPKDPITRFRSHLLDFDLAGIGELAAIDTRIADEVRVAALEAEAAAQPDASDIEARVFVSSNVEHAPSTEPAGPVEEAPRAVPDKAHERAASGSRITYHRAIHDALGEEMERDPKLFLIGEDIGISGGAFKITEGFSKRFDGLDWSQSWNTSRRFVERRVIDAPIAESGFTGLALGAVLTGLRSVVEFQYADFASEAFKMIVNYAATQTVRGMGPVPVVFRLPSGWAANTSLYHSVNPESWFASTPGLKVVAPITAFDAKGLLKAAIRDDNPVLFLEYKAHYRTPPDRLPGELNLPVPAEDHVVPIGVARVLRSGSDVSVITYGSQVLRALAAADQVWREDRVSVEVIDLRTIVPYDHATVLKSVEKTTRAIVTCEAPRTGAFGNTLVTDIVAQGFQYLDAPVRLVAAADTPVPFAPSLEEAHLPTTSKLAAAIREVARY